MRQVILLGIFFTSATLGVVSHVSAASIGIDFGTGANLLAPTDSAGLYPQQNYNQAPGSSGTVLGLMDQTGNATTANLSYSNFTGTFDFASVSNPNEDLVHSGAYIRNSALTPVLTVTNVPYSKFDVVLYSVQALERDSLFNIGTQNIYLQTGQSYPPFVPAEGTFAGDPEADGNYVLFQGVSGPSFTLNIQGLTNDPYFQTALGGIQIIDQTPPPIPEPSTALLLGLGVLGLTGQTRRRRIERQSK